MVDGGTVLYGALSGRERRREDVATVFLVGSKQMYISFTWRTYG